MLRGGADNDTLDGGTGADSLDGGAGIDTASYGYAASRVELSLQTGHGFGGEAFGDSFSSIENVTGSNFNDYVAGDSGRNRLEGGNGADALRVFGHIVLPYIAPVLVVCTLFRLIDSIKAFPLIFLLTGGGPGSVTEVTNYYAYLVAFNFGELGYSSAITVVLLTATVIISWAAMRMSRRAEGMQ